MTTCATAPLIMVDAITGWTWSWGIWNPINSNTPTSIMVVFNKPLDLDTVQITDFAVASPYKLITDMVVHTEVNCGVEWQGWTFVFLTVSPIMKTDEMPTVQLKAGQSVEDETGELILEGLVALVCQDGIAPIVGVTANPAEPGYNEMVTITIQASEELSEAYFFVGEDSPQDYCWNTYKPISCQIAP
ncbi:unnamed protein product [marine sediment metagenome]|uniref:Uncharacterized protein n=1 Tax=marine sediment metagenome TaxID=412755 RepID=X1JJF2_9ZZZZ